MASDLFVVACCKCGARTAKRNIEDWRCPKCGEWEGIIVRTPKILTGRITNPKGRRTEELNNRPQTKGKELVKVNGKGCLCTTCGAVYTANSDSHESETEQLCPKCLLRENLKADLNKE